MVKIGLLVFCSQYHPILNLSFNYPKKRGFIGMIKGNYESVENTESTTKKYVSDIDIAITCLECKLRIEKDILKYYYRVSDNYCENGFKNEFVQDQLEYIKKYIKAGASLGSIKLILKLMDAKDELRQLVVNELNKKGISYPVEDFFLL